MARICLIVERHVSGVILEIHVRTAQTVGEVVMRGGKAHDGAGGIVVVAGSITFEGPCMDLLLPGDTALDHVVGHVGFVAASLVQVGEAHDATRAAQGARLAGGVAVDDLGVILDQTAAETGHTLLGPDAAGAEAVTDGEEPGRLQSVGSLGVRHD